MALPGVITPAYQSKSIITYVLRSTDSQDTDSTTSRHGERPLQPTFPQTSTGFRDSDAAQCQSRWVMWVPEAVHHAAGLVRDSPKHLHVDPVLIPCAPYNDCVHVIWCTIPVYVYEFILNVIRRVAVYMPTVLYPWSWCNILTWLIQLTHLY